MKLTKRRVAVGSISTAVVLAMTSVTTWALADTKPSTPQSTSPVRLIVGYKDGANRTAAANTLSAAGANKLDAATDAKALEELHAAAVQVPGARSAATIAALRSDPNVAYVEVDQQRKASLVPNDEAYRQGEQPEIDEVRAPQAWDSTTGGSSPIKIAVVDTGVNGVGDLSGAVLGGYDFVNKDTSPADDAGHGTAVAALIAARGNNTNGMAGLCWTCRIIPVKVLDSQGSGWDSDVAAGITYAVKQGAKIINLSLGGPGASKVLSDAVAYANTAGVLVVAAAGNKSYPTDPLTTKSYPAAYTDVVAVAATAQRSTTLASYSYRNKSGDGWVDLAAPGTVTSMDRFGNYETGLNGTSFAAPIVSGIAGLIKAKNPNFTGWSLMQALQRSAAKHPLPAKGVVNYGKIDAKDALTFATDTTAASLSTISPPQNALVRGTTTITPVGIGDNWSGIRNVNLYVNGVAKGVATKAPFGVPWATNAYNGATKVELRIWDKAGNQRIVSGRVLIVDNVKPVVKITSAPKSGSKISGNITVKFAVSDNRGVKVTQLLINGKVSQQRSTTTPFTIKATSVPNNGSVQLRTYDKAGNVQLSAKYTYKR
ncbi:S8 family serine peptidase [Actinoplanes sp. NPDC049596]|uniref:S8 family serine peptidase n=1 Tax=unclassified Actinoplanes TaxID=2626549 RepID=UPI003444DC1F